MGFYAHQAGDTADATEKPADNESLNIGSQGASNLPYAEKSIGQTQDKLASIYLGEWCYKNRTDDIPKQIYAYSEGTDHGIVVPELFVHVGNGRGQNRRRKRS